MQTLLVSTPSSTPSPVLAWAPAQPGRGSSAEEIPLVSTPSVSFEALPASDSLTHKLKHLLERTPKTFCPLDD
jgi:hypothetical protein